MATNNSPLPQNELTKAQIDKMTQKEWDDLPIVTGTKEVPEEAKGKKWIPTPPPSSIELDLSDKSPVSPNLRDDLPKLEAEKPQPNKAVKITRGILSLLSPHFALASKAYTTARVVGSMLNKAKIDYRDQQRNK